MRRFGSFNFSSFFGPSGGKEGQQGGLLGLSGVVLRVGGSRQESCCLALHFIGGSPKVFIFFPF